MVTFKIIFVLLFLSASTIVNVAGIFGARLRFPFPYPKFPAIPVKPKTTPAPTEPPPFSPLKDSKYCDESDLAKILSKEQRNKRAVSWRLDACKYRIERVWLAVNNPLWYWSTFMTKTFVSKNSFPFNSVPVFDRAEFIQCDGIILWLRFTTVKFNSDNCVQASEPDTKGIRMIKDGCKKMQIRTRICWKQHQRIYIIQLFNVIKIRHKSSLR